VEAFEHYQLNEAWTWEHMAMSRGRPIGGHRNQGARVSDILDRVVAMERDRSELAAEVAAMRSRIGRDKPAGGSFDVKLAPGGLVDCEFAAQFLVLSGLRRRFGETTPETLRRAMAEGRLDAPAGEWLTSAAELQAAILHVQRIASDRSFDPDTAPDALKRLMASIARSALPEGFEASGSENFEELAAALTRTQSEARPALEELLGIPID